MGDENLMNYQSLGRALFDCVKIGCTGALWERAAGCVIKAENDRYDGRPQLAMNR